MTEKDKRSRRVLRKNKKGKKEESTKIKKRVNRKSSESKVLKKGVYVRG